MQKIELIVPVSKSDAQRATLMLKSLETFFDSASLSCVTLIVPDSELFTNLVQEMHLTFPVRVVLETTLVPHKDVSKFKKKHGWIKQQLLKILASRIVKTKFYLCMDADVICFRPTNFDCLVRDGKPIVNLEPKENHAEWWKDSASVLRIQRSNNEKGMGVTPSILIKDQVLEMIEYIERSHQRSLISVLANWWWTEFRLTRKNWTEFTLYWSYLEHRHKTDLYSYDDSVYGKSIWFNADASEDYFREIFSDSNTGYFTVCQSTGVADTIVSSMVKKHLFR